VAEEDPDLPALVAVRLGSRKDRHLRSPVFVISRVIAREEAF
jgi:hypothetical protein